MLTVELVEHPQAQLDGLAPCGRQLDARKRIPSGSGARAQESRHRRDFRGSRLQRIRA
jgi:hypothetical protein